MSTQAWQSNYFATVNSQECEDKELGMNWEGADFEEVRRAQLSTPSLVLYLCTHLLNGGKECKYSVNTAEVTLLPQEKAQYYAKLPGMTGGDIGALQACLKSDSKELCVKEAAAKKERVKTWVDGIIEAAGGKSAGVMQIFGTVAPSLTKVQLDNACQEPNRAHMFFVHEGAIQSNINVQPYTNPVDVPLASRDNRKNSAAAAYGSGACDHWIFLEACNDDGTYTFFTWGYKVRFSEAFILGGIPANPADGMFCGIVSA